MNNSQNNKNFDKNAASKNSQHASAKVVFNTGVLYAQMFISMGISLYSTRLVLNYLGDSDFGAFNLIAGVISMLVFLNNAMTISTQRFFSLYQGKGNVEVQEKLFVNSFLLHFAIGVIIVTVLEIVAPFLFNGFLNIALDRIDTAKTVYHFMVLSVFFTIITVPFTALLNAHENMIWIVMVRIIELFFKLGIAISLAYFSQANRLAYYGMLMSAVTLLSLSLYAFYCFKNYNECKLRNFSPDKTLLIEITGFAGWNTLTAFTRIGRSQGIAVVLNFFYGTVVNAAYGIATQITAQLHVFCTSMQQALNPQLMKSEGANNRKLMLRLSMVSSKFGFLILAFIAIPCIAEMPIVLKLWLKNIPDNTVIFCSLSLCIALVQQLFIGLFSAFQALGDLKRYVLICEGIIILNLPVGYLLLWIGLPAYSILLSLIFIEAAAGIAKMLIIRKMVDMPITEYINRVILAVIKPTLITIIVVYAIIYFFSFEYRFLFTVFASTCVFAISIYYTSLEKDEKQIISSLLAKFLK